MNNLQEKRLAIAESIIETAGAIAKQTKNLPVKNRYFFKRKNIRGLSRQNKRQRKTALFNMAFSSLMGAAQIQMISSQPIPKFQSGGSRGAGKQYETMAWVGENDAKIIRK
jgi:hypothetical protein